MGRGHIDAARLWKHGTDGQLAMDSMPQRGAVTTYSANDQVTDSAAAATAMATGYKTNNGFLSVAPDGTTVLETVLEQAEARGRATGLVVTSSVTHATPAAFFAHVDDRDRNNQIAAQAMKSGIEVLLGGGLRHFLPTGAARTTAAEPVEGGCRGNRRDSRDLLQEAGQAGYWVVTDRAGLLAATSSPLLGLFACGNMDFDLDRLTEEPSLAEMTSKAIELLERDRDGFFLMVEGSRIDHASDDNDGWNALGDTAAFDQAVQVALDFARRDGQTLVIATADHETGGLSVRRLVQTDGQSSTLPGQRFPIAGRPDESLVLTWSTNRHTAEEVSVFAYGPMSDQFAGLLDNTDIYRIMAGALGFQVAARPIPTPAPAPTPVPTVEPVSVEQTCTSRVGPVFASPSTQHPNGDGVLKIGLTGHANLWWMGRSHGLTNVERAKLVAGLMDQQQVDFTVWLGDDFRLCNQEQLARFVESARAFSQPVFKVLGNHDLDDVHGQLITEFQRERFRQLFGHDIYWYMDVQGFRLVFLANEVGQGQSYVSGAQVAFLQDALDTSPYPVLIFAHHSLPLAGREQMSAMIGNESLNTRKLLDMVKSSGKVIFWAWNHHFTRGMPPAQADGIVIHDPHFITGYVDEAYVDTLEASVLTLSPEGLTIEVFDVLSSSLLESYVFALP